MVFVYASLAWVAISAAIGGGILLGVHTGNWWLLILSAIALVAAVGKYGCKVEEH